MNKEKRQKIIVACDSFKGSLSSRQAGEAVAAGVREAEPDADVRVIAVADGGEGFVEAVREAVGGAEVECCVQGPLGEEVTARYALVDDGECAVMELAEASGLGLVPEDERNPLYTTTYGTGEMIADALGRGCRRIVMGIGGSATVDGGMGLLSALGVRFLDAEGRKLWPCGGALNDIAEIDMSGLDKRIFEIEITVACDVDNVLCGPQGAAFVFGPQKGATPEMCEVLDRGLERFAELAKRCTGRNLRTIPGGGAAGGVGAAMAVFLGARLVPGSKALLESIGFDGIIAGADIIITGEGHIDRQTLDGKLPYGVLQRGRAKGIPVIAVAGRVSDAEMLLESGFTAVLPAVDEDADLVEAMKPENASANIRRAMAKIFANN